MFVVGVVDVVVDGDGVGVVTDVDVGVDGVWCWCLVLVLLLFLLGDGRKQRQRQFSCFGGVWCYLLPVFRRRFFALLQFFRCFCFAFCRAFNGSAGFENVTGRVGS